VRRLLRSSGFYYALAALVLIAGIVSQVELRVPSRPKASIDALAELRERDDVNVIFLLIDTLRADHLGVYGYERDTSPTIDELARYGIRFANVRAQSTWTKTSMASMWTATYPATTGVLRYNHGLSETPRMPAEIFREAGFRTSGIFRNGWVASNFGFGQGFDLYFRPVPSRTKERYEQARAGQYTLQGTDLDATEAAIEFLRSSVADRFFLYVHYMDAHQYLYEQNFAEFGTAYKDAYDNAIKWTDFNVATLVAALDELGLFDNTVLVIGSDHGEAFLEHGREGHAQDLYAEVVDVPWIVSLPFRLEQPVVVDSRVRNVDIWPTVLDMLGLPAMEGADGRSLVPLIEATARGTAVDGAAPSDAYTHLDQTWGRSHAEPKPLVGLDENGFRLIYSPLRADAAELYDTTADPGELHDVAAEHTERRDAMIAKAREYLAREPWEPPSDVELNSMELDQLRALGYVLDDGKPKKNGK
jgi:arylsulfatase A-like enzyme